MATHSSVLARRIPGTGEPGVLPSMGSHRVRHDCSDSAAAAALIGRTNVKAETHILAIWCEELTHLKRPWCWERLRAGGEGDDREWDGWMASLTQWTWVWINSGSWWWTGRPGMLWFMCKELDTKHLVAKSRNHQLMKSGTDLSVQKLTTAVSPAIAGDICVTGSIPGSARSPGGGQGDWLQHFCLENPMDRLAWQATVHRVTKSQRRLRKLRNIKILKPRPLWRCR